MADTSVKKVKRSRLSLWVEKFKAADKDDKKRLITDLLFNNAMYIIIAIAVIFIAIKVPAFLSVSSIVNIVSLTAAGYCGMYRINGYRYFSRSMRRSYRLRCGFASSNDGVCKQDVSKS